MAAEARRLHLVRTAEELAPLDPVDAYVLGQIDSMTDLVRATGGGGWVSPHSPMRRARAALHSEDGAGDGSVLAPPWDWEDGETPPRR